MSGPKLTFRARRGKGGVALAMAEAAIANRIDGDITRILAGGATDADAMRVQEYLEHCEAQARRGQS